MKTQHLFPFILLLACGAVHAGEEPPLRTITVTGTSVTNVPPDIVHWNISCIDEHVNLETAKEENSRKVEHILEALRQLNAAPEDIQAGPVRIDRVFNHDNRGNAIALRHYSVRRNVRYIQRDLSRYEDVFSALADMESVEVSTDFDSSRMEELRWENRLEAVRIARKKAEEMAAILGAEIKAPLTINEHVPQPAGPWGSASANGMASNGSILIDAPENPDAVSGALEPGTIEIRNTVHVTFELR